MSNVMEKRHYEDFAAAQELHLKAGQLLREAQQVRFGNAKVVELLTKLEEEAFRLELSLRDRWIRTMGE